MGSWVWCKAPLEHLLLSFNPAVDTSHASLLSHPHSPPSWLMISLSFDVLMKSLRLSWMAGPLLANYSIKCKWKGNVTGVICLVNMSHRGFTVFFSMWILNRRWLELNDTGCLAEKCMETKWHTERMQFSCSWQPPALSIHRISVITNNNTTAAIAEVNCKMIWVKCT